MPQTFAMHSVVDVVAAVLGVGVCFWIACAFARRRLERRRQGSALPDSTTLSKQANATESDAGPRRPFRMPAPVVATAPVPPTGSVSEPDLAVPPGPLAPAHLYDVVSRDYLSATTSMPVLLPGTRPATPATRSATRPTTRPAGPVTVPPLPRREPRARAHWIRADWDRAEPNSTRSDSTKQYRTGPGWFGEGEACG
jgi:hypothetical protein